MNPQRETIRLAAVGDVHCTRASSGALAPMFTEAASQADAELRDHLFTQGASQSAELAKTADRLSRQLDEFASSLRAEKLDTSALASGLTDLVNRLTSNGNANATQRASQD